MIIWNRSIREEVFIFEREDFKFRDMKILILGAGDLASGIAYKLTESGIYPIMKEILRPTAVRRKVSFAEAIYEGECLVQNVRGIRAYSIAECEDAIQRRIVPVLADEGEFPEGYNPEVLIDARMMKCNGDLSKEQAGLVIAIGPGHTANNRTSIAVGNVGRVEDIETADCDFVIETMRGEKLGNIISLGMALPDTGIPGIVNGYGIERLLKSPSTGIFTAVKDIGDVVSQGDTVGYIATGECAGNKDTEKEIGDWIAKGEKIETIQSEGIPVLANLTGVIRGLLHSNVEVHEGMKIGDIDAGATKDTCFQISDKALKIGDSVVDILREYEGLRECQCL